MKNLMFRLILTLALLLMAGSAAWGVEYYVTQSGTGDGSTSSVPDSIADANSGTLGAGALASGDIVYVGGAITTTPDPTTAGIIYDGAFPGNAASVSVSGTTVASRLDVANATNYTNTDTADKYATDPLFIDAANDNFGLQSTSPCIDQGLDVTQAPYNILTDRRGAVRKYGDGVDMGSDEYIKHAKRRWWRRW